MAKKTKKKTRKKNQLFNQKRLIQKYHKFYNRGEYSKILEILGNVTGDSNNDQLIFLKSKVLYKQGNVASAISLLQKARVLNPEKIEYLSFTAQIHEENNQLLQALKIYSKIFKSKPTDISSLRKMAMLLERLERFKQALVCYQKLLTLKKDDPDAIRRIGLCYFNLGDLNRAADYYEKAISLGGNTSLTWVLVGSLFLSKGDRENASMAFKKAIDIDSKCYNAYPQYIKSTVLPEPACDELIVKLESQLKAHATLPIQKRLCHFSLGDLYHKKENYRNAIRNYELGNKYRADVVGTFTIDPLVSRLNWCRKHIKKDLYVNKSKKLQDDLPQPVFVVGMPRSGTTLLEQIIASHTLGSGAGELPTIKNIIHDIGGLGDYDNEFLNKIIGLTYHDIKEYTKKYLLELTRHNQKAIRIVDKMPHNLMHVWMIGLLFPEATIIHCERDPLDTCLSCFFTDFNDTHTYKENLYKLGQYYSVYSQFMEHWRSVVTNPIMKIKYEELVDNPESTSRKIIKHIGLDWDFNCLKLRDKDHFSRTASNLQIRKGIYKSSVKRWQKYDKYLGELKQGLQDGKKLAEKAV